jgi:hypothetical protein
MPYIGKADCGTCSHAVDVRSNVRGMAYYKCGRCGVSVQQKEDKGNRLFLAKVRPEADPDEVLQSAPVADETPRESPRIAEPKLATKATPVTTKPAAKQPFSIFNFGA